MHSQVWEHQLTCIDISATFGEGTQVGPFSMFPSPFSCHHQHLLPTCSQALFPNVGLCGPAESQWHSGSLSDHGASLPRGLGTQDSWEEGCQGFCCGFASLGLTGDPRSAGFQASVDHHPSLDSQGKQTGLSASSGVCPWRLNTREHEEAWVEKREEGKESFITVLPHWHRLWCSQR